MQFISTLFKKKHLFVFLTLFGSPAFSYDLLSSETDGIKWHQTTILGSFTAPHSDAGLYWKLSSPTSAEQLSIRLWKAKGASRGLYLLLPGTSGDSTSNLANYLAEMMADRGYDVMVFANPFSYAFQQTFSRDGFIGFPLKDIGDMMTMLEAGLREYRHVYGQPKSIAMIGYSLGGTYAVMMAGQPNKFKIDKFIALNPPVDFQHGMDTLDDYIHTKLQLGMDIPSIVLGKLLPLSTLAGKGLNVPIIGELANTLGDDERVNEGLIGGAFQIELKKITQGLFKTPFYSQLERRRSIESRMGSITFSRYLGYAGMGMSSSQSFLLTDTFENQLRKLDLRLLLKRLENRSNVYVIHSQDDFLLQAGDLADLDRLLGNNLMVFRSGGHCGVDWTPSFAKVLSRIMAR